MIDWIKQEVSNYIKRFLSKTISRYEPYSISATKTLHRHLQPGDILLVEGNQRISSAIKYLTQSTWSHSAMYVGDHFIDRFPRAGTDGLVEANLEHGVEVVPLSRYAHFNTRICRPRALRPEDLETILKFLGASFEKTYDLKNIIDLARYLFPTPPVPVRFRRRMLALGSGDPTQVICSSLLVQAFLSVGFPILPDVSLEEEAAIPYSAREMRHIRDYSLYTPRDFDLSPYFEIIKPTLEDGFDYKAMQASLLRRQKSGELPVFHPAKSE